MNQVKKFRVVCNPIGYFHSSDLAVSTWLEVKEIYFVTLFSKITVES
jgi:hypothetical protein